MVVTGSWFLVLATSKSDAAVVTGRIRLESFSLLQEHPLPDSNWTPPGRLREEDWPIQETREHNITFEVLS